MVRSLPLPVRMLLYGSAGSLATLLIIGIPTAVIPNPFFERMVATTPFNAFFLVTTCILVGVLSATYALPVTCSLEEKKLTLGGVFSFLAVGCPVCNKIVLLLLGASGAVTIFQPLQPFLGVASLSLLIWAIAVRVRSVRNTLILSAALRPARARRA